MSIAGQPGHVGIELRFWSSAPGRIRTRDPLLRRQRQVSAVVLFKKASVGARRL